MGKLSKGVFEKHGAAAGGAQAKLAQGKAQTPEKQKAGYSAARRRAKEKQ